MGNKERQIGPCRRTVLKTISTGIVATGIPSIASAKEEPSKIEIRRSLENPIQLDAALKKRRAYIKTWKSKNRNSDKVKSHVSLSKPQFGPNSSIFSYDFELLEDGTPIEYFGTLTDGSTEKTAMTEEVTVNAQGEDSTDKKAIEYLHDRASKRFEENRSSVVGESNSVSTRSSPSEWSDWETRGSVGDTDIDKPHGTWEWDVSHKSDPSDDSVHSVKTDLEMMAGANKPSWSDDWQNSKSRIRQLWDQTSTRGGVNADMFDHFPKNKMDERMSRSVNLGASGGDLTAGVKFTYSQPAVDVIDQSRPHHDENGDWRLEVKKGTDQARTNTYYNPSSIAEIDASKAKEEDSTICSVHLDVTWVKDNSIFPDDKYDTGRGYSLKWSGMK